MSRVDTATGFAVLGILALGLTVLPLLARNRLASTSQMFQSLLAVRLTRVAVVVMWWWLGWHFLATK